MFLNFVGLVPLIIRKLFLDIEVVTMSENQRIIFKSILTSCFIINQSRSGAE